MTSREQPPPAQHRSELAYEVSATPEQVWQAIATAEGISAWMLPARLDPRVGGELSYDLDGATYFGVVTAYEPHERLAYEEPWPIGERPEDLDPEMAAWFESLGAPLEQVYDDVASATPIATEFVVEAQSGGSTVIRVVTSAYGAGADWEHEFFDQMVEDLRPIMDRLATYLEAA